MRRIYRPDCKKRFLRAYFYFNLNQVFKGVPIYLEPVLVEEMDRPRNTEDEVWQLILNDLTESINEANLPDMYGTGDANKGRISKAAAYALRGKAYLYMEDYEKSEADLKSVGEMGAALFQGDYNDLFKEANEEDSEMIFSVQNISLPGLGSITQKYLGTSIVFGPGWNNYLPHPDFVESFENEDGSTFSWEQYLPAYTSLSPIERSVFFLRDNLSADQIADFKNNGAAMSYYLPQGNEARIRAAYDNRDPRLKTVIITPYSEFSGSVGNQEHTYTLRWPYVGFDTDQPFDIRTDTNNKFYYLWRKWVYEGNSIDNREYGPTDMPLIRYADVLLMLAEALNEQAFDQESVEIVNQVRERAGAPWLQTTNPSLPTYVSNQNDMRERIRNERRWELAIEGINLFDEMRWKTWEKKKFDGGNGAKEIWGSITYPYVWRGDYIYTWAIPQTEIERNPKLEQNPGWQ